MLNTNVAKKLGLNGLEYAILIYISHYVSSKIFGYE